jgi:hypothetical protein
LLQQFDIGFFELGSEIGHLAVEQGHSLGRHQAGLQGERVDRFNQVVVCTCAHTLQDLLRALFAGYQNNVRVVTEGPFSDAPTQLGSIQSRHHPICKKYVERLCRQEIPGARTVRRQVTVMAKL